MARSYYMLIQQPVSNSVPLQLIGSTAENLVMIAFTPGPSLSGTVGPFKTATVILPHATFDSFKAAVLSATTVVVALRCPASNSVVAGFDAYGVDNNVAFWLSAA